MFDDLGTNLAGLGPSVHNIVTHFFEDRAVAARVLKIELFRGAGPVINGRSFILNPEDQTCK